MSALAFDARPRRSRRASRPRQRGLRRDEVRLLVARRSDGSIEHRRFAELPALLDPGDLLVVNVSATIAGRGLGPPRPTASRSRVHFATPAPQLADGWWVVELRSRGRRRARLRATVPASGSALDGGAELELVAPYASGARLMLARFEGGELRQRLSRAPRRADPLRLRRAPWPLDAYQNVYATTPGSAEMPSAGRPFTPELITRLVARGVLVAPITLHCRRVLARAPRAAVARALRGARADRAR